MFSIFKPKQKKNGPKTKKTDQKSPSQNESSPPLSPLDYVDYSLDCSECVQELKTGQGCEICLQEYKERRRNDDCGDSWDRDMAHVTRQIRDLLNFPEAEAQIPESDKDNSKNLNWSTAWHPGLRPKGWTPLTPFMSKIK